jgi:NADH-quinone oxidoreductase subunit M
MTNFPWLTTLGLVPLLGAVVLVVLPASRVLLAKQLALVFSSIPVALVIAMALQFNPTASEQFQFVESVAWIPNFGVNYSLGVDGISLVLIAMAVVLVPLVIIAGWNDVEEVGRGSVKGFFGLILVLETLMIGVFAATDLFLFYVLFEAVLIPVYFLIGRYGGARRQYAAMKFLLYSLVGGLLMLAALIGLYVVSGRGGSPASFDYLTLVGLDIDPSMQRWLFLGFFAAFAIKAPLVPFHTWLPDAAAESRPAVAVLLVGVLDKIGTFGMIRFLLPIFPDASRFFAPMVIVLALIGIIYGALLAIGQTDLKRLIAYTSVSHFGFIALGIFVFTMPGQSGSSLYMVNHGFSTAALFLIAGYLISRRGSSRIADFGGVHRVAPILAGTFLVAGLSSLALPGLSSFVSEFLVLQGAFMHNRAVGIIATLGIVLAALYILLMYKRTMTGPVADSVSSFTDLRGREVAAVAPILAIIIAMGVAPQPVLNVINPAVERVMDQIGATDPVPEVAEGVSQ